MRLSTVFELLLIFLFLALASSRHISKKHLKKGIGKQALNSYCKCTELQCNCCRQFPVVPLKGPGCASLGYQSGDSLRLTMSFGDRVLRNISLAGKRPKPVCMALPGGVSKFCGRLYNIERLEDHFKACLALELRALDELEASLRVSCFNFGPKGVKLEPGEPVTANSRPSDDYDDDDDYDIDDDDDDDDDEFDDDDDEYNDVESDGDYTGFAALSDQIFEGLFFPSDSGGNKKKKPVPSLQQVSTIEVTTKAATVSSDSDILKTTYAPVNASEFTVISTTTVRPDKTTTRLLEVTSTTQSTNSDKITSNEKIVSTEKIPDSSTAEPVSTTEETNEKDNNAVQMDDKVESLEKEIETTVNFERNEYESDEGSAEDELSENDDGIIESQAKVEDEGDEEEDDEDDEEEEEEGDEQESDEQNQSDEKDDNNLLNVFFNRENSNEMQRERTNSENIQEFFPGLMALLKPSPSTPTLSMPEPIIRSSRVHRRMRLPPL